MNIYSIDITGGYSGTVEVDNGTASLQFPNDAAEIKDTLVTVIWRYHFCLLTPDRQNIEFELLRFPDSEWCDSRHLHAPHLTIKDENLIRATKAQIFKMGI